MAKPKHPNLPADSLPDLPKDGTSVITFPEETSERDQVWADIAEAIENRAKALQSDL